MRLVNFSKLKQYALLMRWHRPIGSLLLLWPTLWALWLAGEGKPNPLIVFIFVGGVFLMRSAGCVINDYADRNFDIFVTRTKDRPLAQCSVTTTEAIVLFIVLLASAFLLVLQLNLLTIELSIVAVLLAVIYPFTKRFFYLPQLVLGASFGWSVPMAYAAQKGYVPMEGWLLYGIAVLWPFVYDSIYAMMDKEDDLKIGIKSSVIWFGRWDIVIIMLLQGLVVISLAMLGILLSLNAWFYFSLFISCLLLWYQYLQIKDRCPKKCYQAFVNNNWVGLIIFIGLWLN
jgi:4-hydroxybenzoate polyprenyltransferase